MNINSWIAIGGFAITLGGGWTTYVSFRTDTNAWKTEVAQQVDDLKDQRERDMTQMATKIAELDRALTALAVQDARQIEQIAAMLSSLQRIERNVDALVKMGDGP